MGIRGLTTYIQNRSDYYFDVYELANTKLVIDGASLNAQLYCNRTYGDSIFSGDYDQIAHCVTRFFEDLLRCNVEPLVIIDGGWESKKYQTLIGRFKDRLNSASIINFDNNHRTFLFPMLLPDVFVDVMNKMEIKYYMCTFEADEAAAAIARVLNCPVLSYDSDFYIYGVMYIPFNTLDPHIVRYAKGYVIRCKIYRIEKLLNKFKGLDITLLPLASILLGNDYINSKVFNKFFSELRISKQRVTNYQQLKINRIFNWLKHYTLNDAMNKIVKHVSKNQYQRVVEKMQTIINTYLNISTHMLAPLGFDQQFIDNIVKNTSIYKFQKQEVKELDNRNLNSLNNKYIEEDNTHEDDNIEANREKDETDDEDIDNDGICKLPIIPDETFADSIPEWFMKDHSNGKFPLYFINIISHHVYVLPVQIESMYYPSAHEISMPIIIKICSLLTTMNSNVNQKENVVMELITRENDEMAKVHLNIPKSSVTLENLGMMSDVVRKKIIDETAEIEEIYHLEEVPSSWKLYIAVILYWMKQNSKPQRTQLHLDCLLVSMLLGIIDKKIGFQRSKDKFQRKFADDLARIQETRRLKKLPTEVGSSILANLINETIKEDCIASLPFFLEHLQIGKDLRMYPDKFDSDIVHVFSQFQSCLRHIMHLNALVGCIYETPSIGDFFNGTLLYHFYNNFKTRNDIEAYISTRLKNAPNLIKIFQLLRKKIIDILNSCEVKINEDLMEGYKKLYPKLKINNDFMAQNIQIATLGKLEELSTTIEKLKNTLANQTKNNLIRLIVIDSLSFLIMSVEEPSLRVRLYLNILDELQKLASKYNIAVIVVNELVTQINLKGKIIFDSAGGQSVSSRFLKRLQLTRTASSKFAAKLLKSSIMEQITVPFSIDTDGIRDLV
ncbi:GSCOCG00008559001-RA-CDS [Cotesia congregata]|nr:GSCOCG00008559001-RA-CDS [Cotesia congregata]